MDSTTKPQKGAFMLKSASAPTLKNLSENGSTSDTKEKLFKKSQAENDKPTNPGYTENAESSALDLNSLASGGAVLLHEPGESCTDLIPEACDHKTDTDVDSGSQSLDPDTEGGTMDYRYRPTARRSNSQDSSVSNLLSRFESKGKSPGTAEPKSGKKVTKSESMCCKPESKFGVDRRVSKSESMNYKSKKIFESQSSHGNQTRNENNAVTSQRLGVTSPRPNASSSQPSVKSRLINGSFQFVNDGNAGQTTELERAGRHVDNTNTQTINVRKQIEEFTAVTSPTPDGAVAEHIEKFSTLNKQDKVKSVSADIKDKQKVFQKGKSPPMFNQKGNPPPKPLFSSAGVSQNKQGGVSVEKPQAKKVIVNTMPRKNDESSPQSVKNIIVGETSAKIPLGNKSKSCLNEDDDENVNVFSRVTCGTVRNMVDALCSPNSTTSDSDNILVKSPTETRSVSSGIVKSSDNNKLIKSARNSACQQQDSFSGSSINSRQSNANTDQICVDSKKPDDISSNKNTSSKLEHSNSYNVKAGDLLSQENSRSSTRVVDTQGSGNDLKGRADDKNFSALTREDYERSQNNSSVEDNVNESCAKSDLVNTNGDNAKSSSDYVSVRSDSLSKVSVRSKSHMEGGCVQDSNPMRASTFIRNAFGFLDEHELDSILPVDEEGDEQEPYVQIDVATVCSDMRFNTNMNSAGKPRPSYIIKCLCGNKFKTESRDSTMCDICYHINNNRTANIRDMTNSSSTTDTNSVAKSDTNSVAKSDTNSVNDDATDTEGYRGTIHINRDLEIVNEATKTTQLSKPNNCDLIAQAKKILSNSNSTLDRSDNVTNELKSLTTLNDKQNDTNKNTKDSSSDTNQVQVEITPASPTSEDTSTGSSQSPLPGTSSRLSPVCRRSKTPDSSGGRRSSSPRTGSEDSDEDSGIYDETHRYSKYVFVGDQAPGRQENRTRHDSFDRLDSDNELDLDSSIDDLDSPFDPNAEPTTPRYDKNHFRSESSSTTLSEAEYKKKHKAQKVNFRVVKRQESIVSYKRISDRLNEIENRVCITKKADSDGFGFHIRGGKPVVVSTVEEGSVAEEAGLEVGDALIEVNGVKVVENTVEEVVDIMKQNEDSVLIAVVHGQEDLVTPPVTKCGYLWKQGGRGVLKNWKKRWFELTEDGCLYYRKNPDDLETSGAVVLSNYTLKRAPEVNRENAFKIFRYNARTYYFSAETEQDMNDWALVINECSSKPSKTNDAWMDESSHNVALSALSITSPEYYGYLVKAGNRFKTWKRRYCVLKDACLYYYVERSSLRAQGVAHLHGYRVEEGVPFHKKNGFTLHPPEHRMRTFHFYTEKESERVRWMNAMETSIGQWVKADS